MKLAELLTLGYKLNPNLWIADGWMHCRNCRKHTFHDAYSLLRENGYQRDAIVCRQCQEDTTK